MTLDTVHDLQKAYRAVLASAAEPGSIADLKPLLEKLDLDCPANKVFLLLSLILLDADASFSVRPDPKGDVAGFIAGLTYARIAEPGSASFVFIPLGGGDGVESVAETILGADRGTLVDPHRGATVVIETKSLLGAGPTTSWLLSGPGIEATAELRLPSDDGGRLHAAMEARAEACGEFPMGIDMALVDGEGRLAFLPRSTSAVEA